MKLNIIDKCIVGIVSLIILYAAFINIKPYIHKKSHQFLGQYPQVEEHTLSHHIVEYSEKYHAFEDLFHSKTPVFTYGYNPLSIERGNNNAYHKKLEKKYNSANLNYNYIPYTNWREKIAELKDEFFPVPDNDACFAEIGIDEEFQKLTDVVSVCLANSCIIDAQHHKYTILGRDIDFIIQQLQANNPPTKAN